jgi:hypothetical protein
MDEAISFLEIAMKLGGEAKALATIFLAVAYARAGRSDAARTIYAQLKERSESGEYLLPFYLGLIAASLGEDDQAFDWLDQAYRERSGWMPWLNHEPLQETLRPDARFSDLLRRVGLEP